MKRLERGTYIGGHQAAAISGLHPYMSIMDVYAHCALGVVEDISNNPAVRRGRIVEPGLLDWIEECNNTTLDKDVFIQDVNVPFFAGTIDGWDKAKNLIYEVTTAGKYSAPSWGEDGDPDGINTYKWVQSQWYLGISGAKSCEVVCMFLHSDEVRTYPVERNEKAIQSLRERAESFWLDHVIPKVIPNDVAPESLIGTNLDAIYKANPGLMTDPTPELVAAANDYSDARKAEKDAEQRKQSAAVKLKSMLGDATKSKWDGGSVSWNQNKGRKSTDHKGALIHLLNTGEITEQTYNNVIEQYTQEKPGPRVLRVTIK